MLEILLGKKEKSAVVVGTVTLVDIGNKRLKVTLRNDVDAWVSYLPSEFPDIRVQAPVAVGRVDSGYVLVAKLPASLPTELELLEV